MASLWGGRFEKDMDELVKKYNASIFFDQRMYNEDIDGSIAHVTMLGRAGHRVRGRKRADHCGSERDSDRRSQMARSYSMWMTRISIWDVESRLIKTYRRCGQEAAYIQKPQRPVPGGHPSVSAKRDL